MKVYSQPLNSGRWYPGVATLTDGKVRGGAGGVVGGQASGQPGSSRLFASSKLPRLHLVLNSCRKACAA